MWTDISGVRASTTVTTGTDKCVCVTASVSSVPVHSPDRHVVGDVGDVSAPVCIWQLFDLQSEEPDGGEA